MKKKVIVSSLLMTGLLLFSWSISQKDNPMEMEEEAEMEGGPNPEDWMYRQRAYPYGHIRKDIYLEAMQQWQALSQARSGQDKVWQSMGPTNIGGRITSLAIHPNDDNTIYIGAASGGIFKTTDGGQKWEPIFDQAASLAIGDLMIAPSNPQILYVGTGEANAGGGSLAYDGAGLYKSTDGGTHWTAMGLENTGSTGKVLVHPENADLVYAATMGSLFANNPERGLYRSQDGGLHWEQILYLSDSTGVIDLAMHPTNSEMLFAASWERVRRPNRRQYGGSTSGIYRSNDGGDHWTKLNLPVSPSIPVGRIGLAISPVNPNRLFASVVNGSTDLLQGIYRSDDLGATWTALPLTGIAQVAFMWWFGKIYADPIDADLVYICGLELYRHQLGNSRWDAIMSGVHVDQHALYLEPNERSFILLGNDGGLYRGQGDLINNWTHFNGIPITQFYTSEIDHSQPDRLFGGAQDNGSLRRNIQTGEWDQILGGDGFVTLVDPLTPQFVYAESQYGNMRRSTTGGNSFTNGTPTQSFSETKNWNTPVILDPIQPATVYYGAQRVYRSKTRAMSWQAISPVLVNAPPGSNLAYGTLTTLAVSPADNRIIYAGTDEGSIFRTADDGQNWQAISTGLPGRWVTRISAHPTDPDVAYATFSGYRWREYLPHVFRTENGGASWTDISAGLPEVPVNDLLIDPDQPEQLFLATDAGVYYSRDEGQFWEILGQGLPKVVVSDLTYHSPSKSLVAATFGRSMYRLQLGDDPLSDDPVTPDIDLAFRAFPNPFRSHTQIRLTMSSSAEVLVEIFDLSGRRVGLLHQGYLPTGTHDLGFQTNTPGSYVCRMQYTTAGKTRRPVEKRLLLIAAP